VHNKNQLVFKGCTRNGKSPAVAADILFRHLITVIFDVLGRHGSEMWRVFVNCSATVPFADLFAIFEWAAVTRQGRFSTDKSMNEATSSTQTVRQLPDRRNGQFVLFTGTRILFRICPCEPTLESRI
jgi:hypothetical protein